jgi:hypothetical protein
VILPNKAGSIKFAVIGDTGTGDKHQLAVAEAAGRNPLAVSVRVRDYGRDNIYVRQLVERLREQVFDGRINRCWTVVSSSTPRLATMTTRASVSTKPFNMKLASAITPSKPADGVRFYALDSTYMDDKQLKWFEDQLKMSARSGRSHFPSTRRTVGRDARLRRDAAQQLEPLFVKYGITRVDRSRALLRAHQAAEGDCVLHFTGSSAKLREGNIKPPTSKRRVLIPAQPSWSSRLSETTWYLPGDDGRR